MAEVDVNSTGLLAGRQSAIDVDASAWFQQQPNSYGKFGATIKTVARSPISQNRQREAGGVVGLDSTAEIDCDLTREAMMFWGEPALLTTKNGPASFRPTAVTATGYTVAAGGDLAAGILIYASGFTNSANNGLKVVGAASIGTEIKTAGLVAEAAIPAAQNVRVEVCGVQCAAGDLVVASSSQITATTLNFTAAAYGLTVGQFIGIGGATGGALVYNTVANRGLIRLRTIAAGAITFDKALTTFAADVGAGKTIQIFFGPFLRNVAVTDADYAKNYVQLERSLPDLDGGSDSYQYPVNNLVDEMTLDFQVENKATMKVSMVGTDTPDPSTSRKAGASTAGSPVLVEMFNTTSDMLRMRVEGVDYAGITTDLESLSLKIKNNISPKKILGTLGASKLNVGQLEVDLDVKAVLTSPDVIEAVRNNTTVQLDVAVSNGDGALVFDIPAAKLGGGDLDMPINDSVSVNLTGMAHRSTTFGTSLMVSIFPYVPADY